MIMKTLIAFSRKWQGLMLATLFCTSLLLIRVAVTENFRFIFLIWNLILAYVPLVVSLYLRRNPGLKLWKVCLFSLVWLLFYPNAAYIVTDLMHLTKQYRHIAWFDSLMIFSFAITAMFSGVISILIMKQVLSHYLPNIVLKYFLLFMMPLTGFGIYLGRFERWNSWDILTNPHSLILNCFHNLANTKALAVSFAVGGCLYIVLLLLKQASQIIYDQDL